MPETKAAADWRRENKCKVTLNIMRRTEADILARLDAVPNRSRYIKELIRADIARSQKAPADTGAE